MIDAEGNQVGAMPTSKALKMAEEAGLDLVEVAPNARPPVCRILDYGKFKYEQKKKQRGKPKTQSSVLKEIRVRPKIDTNDVAIKVRKAREFLEAGNKVQVTCLFRGREMAYQNLGREVLERVVELLSDVAKLERSPRMEGRRMNILLARKPGAVFPPKDKKGPVEDDELLDNDPELEDGEILEDDADDELADDVLDEDDEGAEDDESEDEPTKEPGNEA